MIAEVERGAAKAEKRAAIFEIVCDSGRTWGDGRSQRARALLRGAWPILQTASTTIRRMVRLCRRSARDARRTSAKRDRERTEAAFTDEMVDAITRCVGSERHCAGSHRAVGRGGVSRMNSTRSTPDPAGSVENRSPRSRAGAGRRLARRGTPSRNRPQARSQIVGQPLGLGRLQRGHGHADRRRRARTIGLAGTHRPAPLGERRDGGRLLRDGIHTFSPERPHAAMPRRASAEIDARRRVAYASPTFANRPVTRRSDHNARTARCST